MMMKTALVVFASVVGVLQAQSDPTPPPPPPEAFQGSSAAGHRPAGAGGVLGVHEGGVQSVSSSSLYKWVYCNGSWRRVTRSTCPAVFVDPDFSELSQFCNYGGSLAGVFPGYAIWLFNPSSSGFYPFTYCRNMPTCFCEACSSRNIGYSPSSSSSSSGSNSQIRFKPSRRG